MNAENSALNLFVLYEMKGWNGFVAPAGVPEAVLAKPASDLSALYARPDFVKEVTAQGMAWGFGRQGFCGAYF